MLFDTVGKGAGQGTKCAIEGLDGLGDILVTVGKADQMGAVIEHTTLEQLLLEQCLGRPVRPRDGLTCRDDGDRPWASALDPFLQSVPLDSSIDAVLQCTSQAPQMISDELLADHVERGGGGRQRKSLAG